jgi:hypothetical protein
MKPKPILRWATYRGDSAYIEQVTLWRKRQTANHWARVFGEQVAEVRITPIPPRKRKRGESKP